MEPYKSEHHLDFFQHSCRGDVLRIMTLNDITYWGAWAFINVVIALFVIEFIEGGSATHVGVAMMLYNTLQAVFCIPFGRFFDTHSGYLDEVWGLAAASAVGGGMLMALSFATQLWHYYVAMSLLGIVAAVNITSWRILFYNNIKKEEYGQTVGIYQTFYSIGLGVAFALSGFVGERFGFDVVIFYGGAAMFFGSFLPVLVKHYFKKVV